MCIRDSFNITNGILANSGITCATFANVDANPKKKVAANIPKGLHCPKINAANARNPNPATLPLNSPEYVTNIIHPPKAANAPDIITPTYLVLITLIPAAWDACGFSPQDLNLNPNEVLYNKNALIINIANTSHVVAYVFVKNNGPITGISFNTGILFGKNPKVILILPLPVIFLAKNTVKAQYF